MIETINKIMIMIRNVINKSFFFIMSLLSNESGKYPIVSIPRFNYTIEDRLLQAKIDKNSLTKYDNYIMDEEIVKAMVICCWNYVISL